MGTIWNAAKRGEGYQLARESNITWVIVGVVAFCNSIFRFFSGRPLMGDDHRKSNATWSKVGTQLRDQKARAPFGWDNPHGFCWSRLPEKRRAAIRVGLLVIAIAIGWGWWTGTPVGPSIIHDTFTITGIGFTWYFLYRVTATAIENTRNRRHRRDRENPLKDALAPLLGQAASDIKLTLTPRNPS